jgi:hypothetical protein
MGDRIKYYEEKHKGRGTGMSENLTEMRDANVDAIGGGMHRGLSG